MTETVTASRADFAAAIGPDLLRIPAEPNRLKQAGQQLGELADHLAQSGEHLTGADGRHEDRQGHTTSALMSVATWNGKRLGKDATLLRELSGAVDHAAQVIGDIQAHDLPQLRRRWAQAQDQFMTEMRHAVDQDAQERQQAEREAQERQHAPGGSGHDGGGQNGGGQRRNGGGHAAAGGPGRHAQEFVAPAQPAHQPALPHPDQLLQQLDEHLVQPYADLFRQLHGPHSSVGGGGGGGGQAFLSDSRTEHTISAYRQTVRSVLEEFAALAQRVQQADKAIEERSAYPAADKADDEGAVATAMTAGDMVSGVASLRHLVQDLREGAQANDKAHDGLRRSRRAHRRSAAGPPGQDGDGSGSVPTGPSTPAPHGAAADLCSRVDDVLEKFSRLDAECAAAIRAH